MYAQNMFKQIFMYIISNIRKIYIYAKYNIDSNHNTYVYNKVRQICHKYSTRPT